MAVGPGGRGVEEEGRAGGRKRLVGVAEGKAVVVRRELEKRGVQASLRTVQRAVAEERRAQHVADVATVRFETPPGKQMQIDFGQKRVLIGDPVGVVHLSRIHL